MPDLIGLMFKVDVFVVYYFMVLLIRAMAYFFFCLDTTSVRKM